MVSVSVMLMGCLASAVSGFLVSAFLGRFLRPIRRATTEIVPIQGEESARTGVDIDRLVSSLYELTSQVDSQVCQHTQKVSEITNSISEPNNLGSELVLVAGRMLVTANQKLQADLEEAKKEIQRQREEMNSCIQVSLTDPLTGVANRRSLELELVKAFARHRREGITFSVLMIDIDYFKRVNDQYGHMVGDQLLKSFSRCLTNTFRESDFVARFGGEEFVAILKKTSLDDGCKAAERVRKVINGTRYKIGDLDIPVTVSIGVKEVSDLESEAELLQKVDDALYTAKNSGRNRCVYHDGTTSLPFVPVVESVVPEVTGTQKLESVPPNGESVVVPLECHPHSPKKTSISINADKNVQ